LVVQVSALAREAKELQGRTGGAHKKEEKPAPPSANGELIDFRDWIHKKQNPEADLFYRFLILRTSLCNSFPKC
jgi:hypothetical protein